MAKDKVGKVAGKKDEPKKSKKVSKAAQESGLSAERVVESDSEQEAKAVKSPAKKEKSGEKKASKKKKKAATPPPPPPPPPKEHTPSESSDEQESDSDEEMPDAPVVPKKPEIVPAKVNGVKRKAEEEQPEAKRVKVSAAKDESSQDSSSDDEETDSEESAEDKADATAAQAKAQPAVKGDTDSDGSSDESSDEEESDSEEENKASKAPTSAPKTSTTQAATMSHIKAIPVKPFKPPHAYSAASVTSSAFSASNLAGKQVWVITAPSSVPLKGIKEVSLAAVQSGAPILEHNGISYKLSEESSRTTEFDSAILPSSKSYDPAKQRIVKKLVLQRKIDLPNLTAKQADIATGSKAAANIAMPAVSTARPQPKGMRMRYKPPGFGSGDPGLGSDSEEESARPAKKDKSLQFPKALGGHGASDKLDVETPKKSKKKHKNEDVDMVNGGLELKLSKTLSKESVDSKDGLSKEERRKRKEEKRARKEAKAKAANEK